MKNAILLAAGILLFSCSQVAEEDKVTFEDSTVTQTTLGITDTAQPATVSQPVKLYNGNGKIATADVDPVTLLNYAYSLQGVPYVYASTDPSVGFDCSGFITYVFNHFNIAVPRSSVDFTNVGKEVDVYHSRPGDLILFTGTDSSSTIVGHMGIISENSDSVRFIHSTSGRANGVTVTALNQYYQKRFVKVIRIFPG